MSFERIPPVIPVYASEDFMLAAAWKSSLNITAYPPDVTAIIDIARAGDALLHPLGGLALFTPTEISPEAEIDPNTPMYEYVDGNSKPRSPWGAVQKFYNSGETQMLISLGVRADEQDIARQLFITATALPGETQALSTNAGYSAAEQVLATITGVDMQQFTRGQQERYEGIYKLRPVNLHIRRT